MNPISIDRVVNTATVFDDAYTNFEETRHHKDQHQQSQFNIIIKVQCAYQASRALIDGFLKQEGVIRRDVDQVSSLKVSIDAKYSTFNAKNQAILGDGWVFKVKAAELMLQANTMTHRSNDEELTYMESALSNCLFGIHEYKGQANFAEERAKAQVALANIGSLIRQKQTERLRASWKEEVKESKHASIEKKHASLDQGGRESPPRLKEQQNQQQSRFVESEPLLPKPKNQLPSGFELELLCRGYIRLFSQLNIDEFFTPSIIYDLIHCIRQGRDIESLIRVYKSEWVKVEIQHIYKLIVTARETIKIIGFAELRQKTKENFSQYENNYNRYYLLLSMVLACCVDGDYENALNLFKESNINYSEECPLICSIFVFYFEDKGMEKFVSEVSQSTKDPQKKYISIYVIRVLCEKKKIAEAIELAAITPAIPDTYYEYLWKRGGGRIPCLYIACALGLNGDLNALTYLDKIDVIYQDDIFSSLTTSIERLCDTGDYEEAIKKADAIMPHIKGFFANPKRRNINKTQDPYVVISTSLYKKINPESAFRHIFKIVEPINLYRNIANHHVSQFILQRNKAEGSSKGVIETSSQDYEHLQKALKYLEKQPPNQGIFDPIALNDSSCRDHLIDALKIEAKRLVLGRNENKVSKSNLEQYWKEADRLFKENKNEQLFRDFLIQLLEIIKHKLFSAYHKEWFKKIIEVTCLLCDNHGKKEYFDLTLQLLENIQKDKANFSDQKSTFESVVKAYFVNGFHNKALEILDQCVNSQKQANGEVNENLSDAIKWKKDLLESFFRLFCKNNQLKEAYNLIPIFADDPKNYLDIRIEKLLIILSCCKENSQDIASELVREIQPLISKLHTSSEESFSLIEWFINILFDKKLYDEIFLLVDKLPEQVAFQGDDKPFKMKMEIIQVIKNLCVKDLNVELADRLFRRYHKLWINKISKLPPKYIIRDPLELLGRSNKELIELLEVEEYHHLFNDMIKRACEKEKPFKAYHLALALRKVGYSSSLSLPLDTHFTRLYAKYSLTEAINSVSNLASNEQLPKAIRESAQKFLNRINFIASPVCRAYLDFNNALFLSSQKKYRDLNERYKIKQLYRTTKQLIKQFTLKQNSSAFEIGVVNRMKFNLEKKYEKFLYKIQKHNLLSDWDLKEIEEITLRSAEYLIGLKFDENFSITSLRCGEVNIIVVLRKISYYNLPISKELYSKLKLLLKHIQGQLKTKIEIQPALENGQQFQLSQPVNLRKNLIHIWNEEGYEEVLEFLSTNKIEKKSDSLFEIFDYLCKEKRFDEAEVLSEAIADFLNYEARLNIRVHRLDIDPYHLLACIYCQEGKIKEAKRLIKKIDNPSHKDSIKGKILEILGDQYEKSNFENQKILDKIYKIYKKWPSSVYEGFFDLLIKKAKVKNSEPSLIEAYKFMVSHVGKKSIPSRGALLSKIVKVYCEFSQNEGMTEKGRYYLEKAIKMTMELDKSEQYFGNRYLCVAYFYHHNKEMAFEMLKTVIDSDSALSNDKTLFEEIIDCFLKEKRFQEAYDLLSKNFNKFFSFYKSHFLTKIFDSACENKSEDIAYKIGLEIMSDIIWDSNRYIETLADVNFDKALDLFDFVINTRKKMPKKPLCNDVDIDRALARLKEKANKIKNDASIKRLNFLEGKFMEIFYPSKKI